MEAFKLEPLRFFGQVQLDPQAHGGAFLDVDDFDGSCTVDLTRLELVALRDWLIAYTG